MDDLHRRILAEKENVEVPASSSWHKELLNSSASRGIISEKLADQLYEYLTFRHFFVHAYGFMLDEAHLEVLADNIPDVWSQFMEEIEMAEEYSKKR